MCAPTAWAADTPAWTATGGDRPYVYLEGPPGTVLEDTLSVTNPGAKPLTVRLRPADAYNTEGGAFAVRDARGSKDTGTWITLAADRVTVPPRTRAEVPFSATVPPGAVPGDHPGAIMAASGGREVGVRIHLRVSGPTLAALTVEDVSFSGGKIHYALVNRGNTALTPSLTVRADGLFGEVLHRKPRRLPLELLPGQRVTLTEDWPDPPSLDAVGIHLRATAPGNASGESTASATFVPWPEAAATGGLLLAAATLTAWLLHSRRHPPDRTEPPEETANERHLARSGA
ncbi:DUF916 domain-containing protein [Streptomyces sp. NBC_01142]|uniref:hypothetical protein n=1 Tax=Streptomyces sp. NBC_01142 TaxID=2975865 RepID=UPI00225124C7|nr:hypothetical protein [Streptomyces sp. NBC_01142]MCX4823573.1 DUF916 domain-containing protein [Streptomyces sp. NBC_01142]